MALLWQHQRHLDPHVAWDRNVLPAFDAYAYVAMAERPPVFTVAPWGYRLLTPALVAALPFRHVERRFQVVTEGALLLAATAVFLFLRRLGHADLPACVGSLAFALSGPVGEAVRYRYLAEPVTVLLEVLLLGASIAGAGTPVLALLLLLGTWSKEFFLLFAPVVLLGRARQVGWRRGFLDMLLAAVPALVASILLRTWWTPHVASPYAALGMETLWLAAERLRTSWPLWLGAVPLHGLTPLALLGAFRASGRRLAPLSLYVAAVALVPPFLNPVAFFPADIPRLLIYALPALIPLALASLEGVWGAPPAPAAVPPSWRPGRAAAAWAAVVLTALTPILLVDRYRRLDLGGPRDGAYVLALCRESWRAARRLERGEAVVLDPAGFTWDPASREELGRMRWFLREGWGDHAHYGTGEVVMKDPRASILLPILTPREVAVELDLVPPPAALAVEVNGQPAGHWRGAGGVRVPARLLFRGDNVVTLVSLDGTRGARLRALAYGP